MGSAMEHPGGPCDKEGNGTPHDHSLPRDPSEAFLLFGLGPGLRKWMEMVLAQEGHRLAGKVDSWTIYHGEYMMIVLSSAAPVRPAWILRKPSYLTYL